MHACSGAPLPSPCSLCLNTLLSRTLAQSVIEGADQDLTGQVMSSLVEPESLRVESIKKGDAFRLQGLVAGARYNRMSENVLQALGQTPVVTERPKRKLRGGC